MNNLNSLNVLVDIVEIIVPIAGLVWYIINQRPDWKKIAIAVAVVVLIIAILLPVTFWGVNALASNQRSTPTPTSPGVAASTRSPAFTATFSPTASPTTTSTPLPANTTDWGTLAGDSITVNKTLTCGDGCPDPVIVEVTTIQINKPSEMTWNLSLSAPTNTQDSGYTEVSFPQFILQSDVTSPYQVNPTGMTAGLFLAKFPFVPVSNHVYTLAVTVSYHRLTGGIVTIQAESVTFNPVTMLFQP